MGITSSALVIGGMPIGATMPLSNYERVVVDAGRDFVRSGVREKQFPLYPDAYSTGAEFSGDSFAVSTEVTQMTGIIWDGTNVLISDNVSDAVYKYLPDGTYTGDSFDISNESLNTAGFAWDGQNFWVCSIAPSSAVYKYLPDGTYTGDSFAVPAGSSGITWDGLYLRISNSTSGNVLAFQTDGTQNTQLSFSTSSQDSSMQDIEFDGKSFFLVGNSTDTVYKYSQAGEYTGFSFITTTEENAPTVIGWNGAEFLIGGIQYNSVFFYDPLVGIETAKTDTDSGLPIYVRIS